MKKSTLLSSILFCLIFQTLFSQPENDSIQLAAFSFGAAKKALLEGETNSDEFKYLGYITRIWGVALDDNGDLLLIGERNPNAPCISFDLAVTALRVNDKVISSQDNPGVSIEPFDNSTSLSFQKVKYYGGIEGTNFGRIVFEADLLLKLLSEGFITSKIEGLPSEFDLLIDNQKADRRINTFEKIPNRSWFFPYKVNYREGYESFSVTSITFIVENELNKFFNIPESFSSHKLSGEPISLNEKKIEKLLNEDPLRLSPIYTKILTDKYKELTLDFPILIEMENAFSLSGLLNKLLKENEFEDLPFWQTIYEVHHVNTPNEIPTLRRNITGLAYGYSIAGGINVSYVEETDPWTEQVLLKQPDFLKEGAVKSRPNDSYLSWSIPINKGEPNEWSKDELVEMNNKTNTWIQKSFFSDTKECSCSKRENFYPYDIDTVSPKLFENWHPNTEKPNLFAFEGEFFANTGGWEIQDNARIFRVGSSDLSIGMIPTLRLVLNNKFEFKVDAPIKLGLQVTEEPSNLPGIAEISSGLNFGIESPTLTNRILIYDGLKEKEWKHPKVILENSILFPTSFTAFELDFTDDGEYSPIGTENWSSTHGVQLSFPLNKKLLYQGFGVFKNIWKKEASQFIIVSNFLLQVDEENDLSVGFRSRTEFNSTRFLEKKYKRGSTVLLASFFYPRKFGYNSMGIGYYFPNSKFIKGGFMLDIRFSGDKLWGIRKWF